MPGMTTIEGPHSLNLPGWDRYSIWGLDRSQATYGLFAHLWQNTDDPRGAPRHRISAAAHDMRGLGRQIAAATRHCEDDVADAIAGSLGWTLPIPEAEQPWIPVPADIRGRACLLDPLGVSHLSFDDEDGRFYRLRQNRPPEPLTAGGAIRLRPSDIDQIIGHALIWIIDHRPSLRCYELCDEIAVGAKAIVMHFARYGGKFRQPPPSPAEQDLAALYAKHADELAAIEEAYKARPRGFRGSGQPEEHWSARSSRLPLSVARHLL